MRHHVCHLPFYWTAVHTQRNKSYLHKDFRKINANKIHKFLKKKKKIVFTGNKTEAFRLRQFQLYINL